MAENLYEGMFLLDSGKFASGPDRLSTGITGLIEKAGGTVNAHRPWQDGRLAYEIEGRRKGVHFLTYFRIDPAALTALLRACKLSDIVIRQLFIKQPQVLFDAMVAALTGVDTSEAAEETSETSASDAKPEDAAKADDAGEASTDDAAKADDAGDASTDEKAVAVGAADEKTDD